MQYRQKNRLRDANPHGTIPTRQHQLKYFNIQL
jgi:hypothetical protein